MNIKQDSKGLTPTEWEEEYSEDKPHWAEDMNPSEFAQEFAGKLKERKAKSILEIGCGNGRDSIFFAQAGFHVYAIDVAPSAIELAESNIEKAEEEVFTLVANAENLHFDNNKFDAVFSLSCLHATDLNKSMPEVYRVLKRKGIAFIYIYGDTTFADGRHEDIIKLDNYIKLIKEIGFKFLDSYSEQEDKFDEFGEKHRLFVSLLEK